MLILTRKPGETIVIDGNIEITVKAIDHNRVKIGVVAPRGVCVDREEVWEAKKRGSHES